MHDIIQLDIAATLMRERLAKILNIVYAWDKKDLYNDLTCNNSVALHLLIVSYKCSSDLT